MFVALMFALATFLVKLLACDTCGLGSYLQKPSTINLNCEQCTPGADGLNCRCAADYLIHRIPCDGQRAIKQVGAQVAGLHLHINSCCFLLEHQAHLTSFSAQQAICCAT